MTKKVEVGYIPGAGRDIGSDLVAAALRSRLFRRRDRALYDHIDISEHERLLLCLMVAIDYETHQRNC